MTQLESVLDSMGVELWWADERDRRSDWVSAADVAVSRKRMAVSVPRRKRGAYHQAEVLHELAHLMRWVQTGVSPASHDDAQVCEDAVELAKHLGFSKSVLARLLYDLGAQIGGK